MQRQYLEEEHILFEEAFDAFVRKEIVPNNEQWEKDSIVSKEVWLKAGAQGFLCTDFAEEYGGMGMFDFRFNAIINEVLSKHCASGPGFTLQNDIMAPYFTEYFTDAQKAKWMSKISSGETVTAIAMTEPRAGSDLAGIGTTAIDKGDHYLLNGAKTFITNGIHSDLVIVVARTNPELKHKGISLLLVETGMEGFSRGKNLDKIGLKAQDTAELFFDNVKVPKENILGEEGQGFYYLMHNLPQERLSLAIGCIAVCEEVIKFTSQYCKDRKAFGQQIGSFQHNKFKLAEMQTETTIGRTFVDQCIMELNEGKLTAEKAAMAKWWASELHGKVVDQCLQLHGGYGFMNEYPIAKFYRDARISRIYGGTTEIMKEIVGRSMGF